MKIINCFFTLLIAVLASVLTLGYLLPWSVSICREHNGTGVLMVNLFAGWTVIGWIIALAMACGNKQQGAS